MVIEATSLPDPPRIVFKRRAVRLGLVFFVMAAAIGADAIVRSYRYYSQIIDARLANGYLTSRPGLYAAPRVLEAGQKLSREKLVGALRRAGYVESKASDVWSGSFISSDSGIEIRPGRSKQPEVVRVAFNGDQIADLRDDVGALLESFTLEPEILSTDLSAKAGKREVLSYGEIPEVMVHAVLAIEDRRFFEHSGVDIRGLGRALLRNAGDERMGQGGSTITQQLVKNTYLTPEKTLQRKYAEAMLAIALERRLSKNDIFALYSNEIYLGQRGAVAVRGIKEAAEVFYGKQLSDITLSEAATLAGMIQSPAHYSPLRHPEDARARRNVVLAAMQQNGWISSEQNDKASAEPVSVTAAAGAVENSMAPYFVDYVNRLAESQFETSGNNQRIYTTVDLELQQVAEQALKRQLDNLDKVYSSRGLKPQASLVALDPHTGNVLAMVGGRNYAESQLNRATDALRQPGSTFKPFVYAAALEDGMSPVQMFMDAPREFVYDRDKIYRPANYGGGYSMREVTMRQGLVRSLNVVTVDVALQTGLARIANLANRFGLPKPKRYPALALGTEEVTPLQLASAYAAFLNGGRRVEAKAITSIGEPPATHAAPVVVDQVVSPTTAYMITNMLAGVIERGTARKARGAVRGTAIAGKTGTSRDGWFVGYSPNLVCVVWIGFDDNKQLGLTGAEAALPAWVDFMNDAIALRPDLGGENFECPEGIKFVEIDSATGLISTVTCPVRELIAVTDRTSPTLECYLHGNLPVQTSPFAEESESSREEIAVKKAAPVPLKDYRATRVDVDLTGRRALVNDMR
jgi:penicillin-binding protein 1B